MDSCFILLSGGDHRRIDPGNERGEQNCDYLDLPIQHASDGILKRMGRRTSKAQLIEIIEKLRREIPDITLRTTLITGFPGETEEQHEELMDL